MSRMVEGQLPAPRAKSRGTTSCFAFTQHSKARFSNFFFFFWPTQSSFCLMPLHSHSPFSSSLLCQPGQSPRRGASRQGWWQWQHRARNGISPVFQLDVVLLSEGKTGQNPGRNAEMKAWHGSWWDFEVPKLKNLKKKINSSVSLRSASKPWLYRAWHAVRAAPGY